MSYPDVAYGKKYERGLTTTQCAARIRADIKEALRTRELPRGLKVSVRSDYFANGSSIDVRVTALPAGWALLNPERVRHDVLTPNVYPENLARYTEETTALLKVLQAIMDAYNYDGSDSQTDYFHVNFYGHAEIGHGLEHAVWEQMAAEIRADEASRASA